MRTKRAALAVAAALLAGTFAGPSVEAGGDADTSDHDHATRGSRSELAQVRRATARYHRHPVALRDGFVAFSLDPEHRDEPTCFDSPAGGMGVHYVRNIDAVLDPTDPEALVYGVTPDGRLRLVAVEYIIPSELVDPADPPELLGQELHPHSFLPVHILHAWVWKRNPAGTFADFNPRVGTCPE